MPTVRQTIPKVHSSLHLSSFSFIKPPQAELARHTYEYPQQCTTCVFALYSVQACRGAHFGLLVLTLAFACGHPGCDARFNARSNALRHRHIHGVEFVRAVDAAEREARETRSETRGDAVFMETIVGQETPASATGGNPRPASLKWMPLNQTARRYTPYELSERRREGASVSLGESSQPNTTQQTEEDLSPAAGQSAS
ncbi:hypothetical protein BD626DRAFT_240814 [Schizophyllum amplum]|uniref:C2H2-type domain-containing protein n=1 Tax=Schizophyllum amplum TaxID=97359 RepID=A0A550CJW3_9AGAR|nr:hypothetical protein BD626DRAFT_240814 [Auriculariopsis ampla]